MQAIHDKMTRSLFRQVEVKYDPTGTANVSEDFTALDLSDRKFLAAALADNGRSTLVNAADSD